MDSIIDINALTDHLVRPPKFTYSISDLGDSIFELDGNIYERIDFTVDSMDGGQKIRLNASIWRSRGGEERRRFCAKDKILIYMHCNCGSRVEAMQIMKNALKSGNSLIAFDSRGSGHSQGKFISLGKILVIPERISLSNRS